MDKKTWDGQTKMFTKTFKSKTRAEWEKIFHGTDACCTPVLSQKEFEEPGFDQRPVVTLSQTPSLAIREADPDDRPVAEGQGIGVEGDGWNEKGLKPGERGEELKTRRHSSMAPCWSGRATIENVSICQCNPGHKFPSSPRVFTDLPMTQDPITGCIDAKHQELKCPNASISCCPDGPSSNR